MRTTSASGPGGEIAIALKLWSALYSPGAALSHGSWEGPGHSRLSLASERYVFVVQSLCNGIEEGAAHHGGQGRAVSRMAWYGKCSSVNMLVRRQSASRAPDCEHTYRCERIRGLRRDLRMTMRLFSQAAPSLCT